MGYIQVLNAQIVGSIEGTCWASPLLCVCIYGSTIPPERESHTPHSLCRNRSLLLLRSFLHCPSSSTRRRTVAGPSNNHPSILHGRTLFLIDNSNDLLLHFSFTVSTTVPSFDSHSFQKPRYQSLAPHHEPHYSYSLTPTPLTRVPTSFRYFSIFTLAQSLPSKFKVIF